MSMVYYKNRNKGSELVMIKSSRVMKNFEQYVKKYDMNNNNIKANYFHSLKVMELSSDIATTIGLFNEEEIAVVELIALFHEIANFDVAPNYKMEQEDVEDFALKSAELLFSNGVLRKISDDTKYDNVIKLAIYACNKNGLPANIDPKTAAFCKILRDAHRIDSFRKILNYPVIDTRITMFPSNMVYDRFKQFKVIDKKLSENNSDEILVALSEIFNLNYRYSYAVLKRSGYVDKIIESLSFTEKNLEGFYKQIGKVLNAYIDRKIGE